MVAERVLSPVEKIVATTLLCFLFVGGWPVVRGLFEIVFSSHKEWLASGIVLLLVYVQAKKLLGFVFN